MNMEQDFRPATGLARATGFLPGSSIEVIGLPPRRGCIRHAVFDFDGTLSLIREGWPGVMIPMLVEAIRKAAPTGESASELERLVRDFVMQLTGKQTIYQMMRLAEEIEKRGGRPEEPLAYKRRYHELLMQRISSRREALRAGRASPDSMLVPGSRELLAELKKREVRLYIASGTDEAYVLEEVRLLGLHELVGQAVYGAHDDYQAFSKAMVIQRILRENRALGENLVVFGDGYVEIQDGKAAGGLAVAVASDEAGRSGRPDAWKRERLIGAGADLVIPDFSEHRLVLDWLGIRAG